MYKAINTNFNWYTRRKSVFRVKPIGTYRNLFCVLCDDFGAADVIRFGIYLRIKYVPQKKCLNIKKI